jgi:hypothetical protein
VPARIEIELRAISQQESACDHWTPVFAVPRRGYDRLAVLIKNLDPDGLELHLVARGTAFGRA